MKRTADNEYNVGCFWFSNLCSLNSWTSIRFIINDAWSIQWQLFLDNRTSCMYVRKSIPHAMDPRATWFCHSCQSVSLPLSSSSKANRSPKNSSPATVIHDWFLMNVSVATLAYLRTGLVSFKEKQLSNFCPSNSLIHRAEYPYLFEENINNTSCYNS